MHNVTQRVEGNKLIIEVDISPNAVKAAPPSSTGKTLLVGTTSGSTPVQGVPAKTPALSYSLNVMAKAA